MSDGTIAAALQIELAAHDQDRNLRFRLLLCIFYPPPTLLSFPSLASVTLTIGHRLISNIYCPPSSVRLTSRGTHYLMRALTLGQILNARDVLRAPLLSHSPGCHISAYMRRMSQKLQCTLGRTYRWRSISLYGSSSMTTPTADIAMERRGGSSLCLFS